MNSLITVALLLQASVTTPPYAVPGEDQVDPYVADNHNAGATPFSGDGMAKAFHGQEGIRRVVATFAALNRADPIISEIFEGHDDVRFRRVLFEQLCYLLNAGCDSYSGRDMASTHKNLGAQQGDMNRVTENLQKAMRQEGIAFAAQNRLLSKLAPMRKDVVER